MYNFLLAIISYIKHSSVQRNSDFGINLPPKSYNTSFCLISISRPSQWAKRKAAKESIGTRCLLPNNTPVPTARYAVPFDQRQGKHVFPKVPDHSLSYLASWPPTWTTCHWRYWIQPRTSHSKVFMRGLFQSCKMTRTWYSLWWLRYLVSFFLYCHMWCVVLS